MQTTGDSEDTSSLNQSFDLSDTLLHLPKLPEEVFNFSYLRDVVQNEVLPSHNHTLSYPLAMGPIFNAPVTKAVLLTNSVDVKTVVEMSFNLTGSSIDYHPGDCLGIVPCNPSSEVDNILEHLRLVNDADVTYKLDFKKGTSGKNLSGLSHIPINSTIRHVLQNCVEIRAVPKKLFLLVLAENMSDSKEKRRCKELCSREGVKEYSRFITEAQTSLWNIFEAFPSCSPPIERLFEFLPRLRARPYSIASSPLNGPEVSIVFSLLELPPKNKTKTRKMYGICTGWLHKVMATRDKTLSEHMEGLSLTSANHIMPTVPLFLRKNSEFRLPEDVSVPLILIGPGTGIAPYIGFLQHRDHQIKMLPKDQTFGEIWLFFGCRYSDKDFIYKSAIYDFLNRGVLSRLFESFSRMKTSLLDSEAGYVQDNIKKHRKEFVNLWLEKKGIVFVCGDAKNMATDILEAIISAVMEETSVTEKEARQLVNGLKKDGRYIQDIWL